MKLFTRMKNVAVLGSGPAGLLAALAADRRGHRVDVISRKTKSEMFGAIFLHKHIPGISPVRPDFTIEIVKTGTRQGYALNVYGDRNHPVSWDKFKAKPQAGWSLHKAYDNLWASWEDAIIDRTLDPETVEAVCDSYDVVISTIPMMMLCQKPDEHKFFSQPIWIVHGPYVGHMPLDYCLMYYNGDTPDGRETGMKGYDWYRYSLINGYNAWEHSKKPKHDVDDRWQLSEGYKPISNTCDCHPTMMRVGRFGRWHKGILTHHAYEEVLRAL